MPLNLSSTQWTLESVAFVLTSQKRSKAVLKLRGDDALSFIDALDRILNSYDLDEKLKNRCTVTLRKICGQCGILPASHMLSSGLEVKGNGPHASGGFADVWQGDYNDRAVAIKALRVCMTDDLARLKKLFCREALVWKRLSHRNVLPFLGASNGPFSFCLVSDWMAHGNIMEYIKKQPNSNRLVLLVDVASGLIYLHSMGLVHGDLKGANILINGDLCACLADFGLMTIISDPSTAQIYASTTSTSVGGTIRWMAPELLYPEHFGFSHTKPTKASDVYALGMVILEVLTGAVPFCECGQQAVTHRVVSGVRPLRPTNDTTCGLSDDIWQVMQGCWDHDHTKRPELPVVFDVLDQAAEHWNPPRPTTPTSEAGSSASDDSSTWVDDSDIWNDNSGGGIFMLLPPAHLQVEKEGPVLPRLGATVPQRYYKLQTSQLSSIIFVMENGNAFTIRRALAKDYTGLIQRDDAMFCLQSGNSISIRIEWPGYMSLSRQVKTMDWKRPPQPITLAKLATEIAKSLKLFIDKMSTDPTAQTNQPWRVGPIGSNYISVDDVALVALQRVSKSSWQPVFRLARL